MTVRRPRRRRSARRWRRSSTASPSSSGSGSIPSEAQQAATIRKMLDGHGQGLAGPAHQAGRPAAQHAHDRGHARVEAAPHRRRDARDLRAAGPPLRDPGHQMAARGPVVRHPAPAPLRRDRADGRRCVRPSARSTWPRCSRRPASSCSWPASPAEVTGRPKHLWSIYEKMVVRGKEFDEIYDLVGVRVLVDSAADCYAALGRDPLGRGRRCPGGSRTTSPRPSSTSTRRCTRPSSGPRASRSRCRSAPGRCTGGPSSGSPPTGATRRTPPRRTSPGCSASSTGEPRPPTRPSSSRR